MATPLMSRLLFRHFPPTLKSTLKCLPPDIRRASPSVSILRFHCNLHFHKPPNLGALTPVRLKSNFPRCFSSTPPLATEKLGEVKQKRENIATIPNMLTASRMVLAPVIGYLVLQQVYGPAMILFGVAGFTDLLDGYVARNFANQASTLGMAIDPLADKLLMTIMTLSLTGVNLFPVALTVLIITRDVLLIASGFALRFFSLSPPKTVKRYFDISLPSAEVYPTFSSKVNTMVQLVAVAASLAAPLLACTDALALKALWVLAGVTTVVSGASYAYNGASCFKILSEDKDKEDKDKAKDYSFSMKNVQIVGGIGFTLGLSFVCWKLY